MLLTETKRSSSFLRKALILIPTKEQFDRITPDPQQPSPPISKHSDSSNPHHEKPIDEQDIVVPRNGLLPTSLIVKHPPKLPKPVEHHGYFRLRAQHNVPHPEKYDLTYSDIQFIRQLKRQYDFNKKYKFQTKTFIAIIQNLQLNFHKLKTVKLDWDTEMYLDYLNFNIPMDVTTKLNAKQKQKVKQMILQIIDYWKKQKVDKRSFPLVRTYWPKSDIAISKYSFWVPYKTRIVEEQSKKAAPIKVMKNFGNTQKEKNLNKQAKDANAFLSEVKDLAETQLTQHARFKKQVGKFHQFAGKYGFEMSKQLTSVVEKTGNPQYMKILGSLQKSVYLSGATVRLAAKSRFIHRPTLTRSYQVSYDAQNKQFEVKNSENIMDEQYMDIFGCQNVWTWGDQHNKFGYEKAKKSRTHSFNTQKKTKGSKRVKVQQQ